MVLALPARGSTGKSNVTNWTNFDRYVTEPIQRYVTALVTGVTDVMVERPETETETYSSTARIERKGLGDVEYVLSSEALAGIGGRKQ